MFFSEKKIQQPHTIYDPGHYRPVLRCSICTGEKVAGFEDRATGRFIDLDFIRSDEDLRRFMKKYGVDKVDKVW